METHFPATLFPYASVRPIQSQLMQDIHTAITSQKHLIAHAPTGLGKTIAALAPALAIAEQKGLTILFLTSRHTQHRLAIDTLRSIKDTFSLPLSSVSMLGKRWMCAQPGLEAMPSAEFSDYCSLLRHEGHCAFYTKTRPPEIPLSVEGAALVETLTHASPLHTEDFVKKAADQGLCPYELGLSLSSQSRVIITDYYYAFHPTISEHFLLKINKPLQDIILIIDEGHNLPARMRELLSTSLTTLTISSAKKEAEKFGFSDAVSILAEIESLFWNLLRDNQDERLLTPDELLTAINCLTPHQELVEHFQNLADEVTITQKRSALGSISHFLKEWTGPDTGFVRFCRRIKTRKGHDAVGVYYNCLDPSFATSGIIAQSHATILMSGTLTPTAMYAHLLGFDPERTIQREYASPFDEANRLALIVPKTTTRYAKRSEGQFMQIAREAALICDAIPGNAAVFFPSYFVRDAVQTHFSTLCRKTQFSEEPGMSKQERDELLERFKGYKDSGAVLLAVASGSFGEGIDLPGDYLRGVIVVGLPLSKPDLETNALIRYYDTKFGKGWDYGYTLPAMTRTLQNAGRCIRTETDRGVIVFLDERYPYPSYLSCFPRSWNLKIMQEPHREINAFFQKNPLISSPGEDLKDF